MIMMKCSPPPLTLPLDIMLKINWWRTELNHPLNKNVLLQREYVLEAAHISILKLFVFYLLCFFVLILDHKMVCILQFRICLCKIIAPHYVNFLKKKLTTIWLFITMSHSYNFDCFRFIKLVCPFWYFICQIARLSKNPSQCCRPTMKTLITMD